VNVQRAEIRISGLVQGVGYRFFAERQGRRYGLKGFCRNVPDGTVEVVVEGDYETICSYIEDLRRGPMSAAVKGVNVKWGDCRGEFNGFRIRFS